MNLTRSEVGDYTCVDDPGEPRLGTPRVSVTDEEAQILGWLARGRGVLEIGTGLGVSTRAMAATARGVVTMDVDPWVQANVWRWLPSMVIGARVLPERLIFEMVFIDGDHHYDSVRADIAIARSKVKRGGLIVVHDAHFAHVDAAMKDDPGTWSVIDTAHGLGLCFT